MLLSKQSFSSVFQDLKMFRSSESKKEYLNLFGELADKISDGSRTFLKILSDFQNYEEMRPEVAAIEQDAYALNHKLREKLYKSYMTPFEPADVQDLAGKMVGIIHLIATSTKKLGIFKLKQPLGDVLQLTLILDEAITRIKGMIKSLGDAKNFEAILQSCSEMRGLKSAGDDEFYKLAKKLFENEKDAFELFNRKQILEHMEEAINTCEDVSGVIEGIILKNG